MPGEVTREAPGLGRYPVLTHPDRVLYHEQGLTKQDLARYYERIAPFMLPHVAGRPLALVRCPGGQSGSCFYQKHLAGKFPEALHRVSIRQSDGIRPYAVVEDLAGLLALVQMGVLELHVWGARADRVEAPDRLVFDLDPGSGVAWAALCDGAEAVRQLLAGAGLQSWVKTTGGKGIHIVAPIERRASWTERAGFARATARALEQHDPDRYVSRAAKTARPGRIYVDWLRNTRGATAVAVWSTRARQGAAVSLPCDWSALRGLGSAASLTVAAVLADGVPYRHDPWSPMLSVRQRLRFRNR
jgi:bifunctional non-homologous end joining protein LigD